MKEQSESDDDDVVARAAKKKHSNSSTIYDMQNVVAIVITVRIWNHYSYNASDALNVLQVISKPPFFVGNHINDSCD